MWTWIVTRIDSQVRWSGQSERVERGSASGVRSSCQVSNQRRTTGHSQHWEDTAPTFGTLQVLTGYSSSIRDSTGIDRIQLQHSGLYRYCQDTAPAFGTLQSTGIDRIQLQHPGLYRYWQDTAPAFGTLHWVYRYCQDTAAPAFGTLQVLTGYSCQLCQIVIWHQFPNFTLKYWI